ncbi:undecaprenyldiphospho-muramoylpentapeptide beta-N-acetylglucosaminyltransferase [Roseibium algae]|uniref:UDP-N-acetylglucosamine--N-acetylmuramyl-(pentapeptide) pyrophosphoryl-undecaprenol N-acetylglucosamine transferase n=1 Tax=Roseibium algae TaxID=3123038 RepID=A0ABU8TM68_9HYPH
MTDTILLTAGGSGGHLFPAQALASELGRRGYLVELATDERADKFGTEFPARKVHIVESETLRGKNPIALAKTAMSLLRGTLQARRIIKQLKPRVVVGFGGYPTFPPMFAARLTGTPSVLHEANGVMGRANKLLAKGATAIATSLPLAGLKSALDVKCALTGNPVRDAVISVAAAPYPMLSEETRFHLLVFGGSQGARFFSDAMPAALAKLPDALRKRIKLVQQCRPEDLSRVGKAYVELKVEAELHSFFTDMPQRIADSHLVISRSGASTVSELAVIGRPAILVPFPGALDQDQLVNARTLEAVGSAWPVQEKNLTPQRLADDLIRLMTAPETLKKAANAALREGKPNAVVRLANLVEQVAAGKHTAKGDAS